MDYALHKDSIEGAQPSFFIGKTAALKETGVQFLEPWRTTAGRRSAESDSSH